MLDHIIKASLKYREIVLLSAVAFLIYGGIQVGKMPIDVFPDLNRPRVTVLTEAHGLAPEEVETLVTLPLETAFNGIPGVMGVRSSSGAGISIVYIEFEWGTDIFRNRQLVSEKLQLAKASLPGDMVPIMGPITSIMGEIQFVGLGIKEGSSLKKMDIREYATWNIRPRLLGIPGVSQVVVMGGELKEYHIKIIPEKLSNYGISLDQLKEGLSKVGQNSTGGFLDLGKKEYLIRPVVTLKDVEDLKNTAVGIHFGKIIRLGQVAKVEVHPKAKRGEASVNGKESVVLTIQKQPHANTVELTKKIEQVLKEVNKTLPVGMILHQDLFKQSHFIKNAISNVAEALRDGTIMVAIVLFLFLVNLRTTTITLISIPLSLVTTFLVFKFFGLTINTMTLGGLAIAIGELVDDAIVDVENVFRRLKLNNQKENKEAPIKVIFNASKEIRNSIVFSTIVVVLVFLPLFAMEGIEGRLFSPLGAAYVISLLASLVVALTATPVLCSYLLPNSLAIKKKKDSKFVTWLKKREKWILEHTIGHPKKILIGCFVVLVGVIALIPQMGRNFLPHFNEGTATLGVAAFPGISLKESNKLGQKIESELLSIKEVKSTIRRTGRAEMDEHAEGVHWSEIDVDFHKGGRPKEQVLEDIRSKINGLGDLYLNVGQPISHRLDHMMSGIRAEIAIKVFGDSVTTLRRLAVEIEEEIADIEGLVDLQIEPLVRIPQLKIILDRKKCLDKGIRPGEMAHHLEVLLNGEKVGKIVRDSRVYSVILHIQDELRKDDLAIGEIVVHKMPDGKIVKLKDVAKVYRGLGPNMINREGLQKRLVVMANTKGRDVYTVVQDIQAKIDEIMDFPTGYYYEIGGQFEAQQRSSKNAIWLGIFAILGVLSVLYFHFRSWRLAFQVVFNIPQALIGSVLAVYITDGEFSLASIVAFITLCGIASRNGILMLDHYIYLIKEEGMKFGKKMVIKGTLDRLVPVLMTAITAICALIPLLLSKGEPGKEILYPVAVVIVGGLLTSTLLDIFVTPAIFLMFGEKAVDKHLYRKQFRKNLKELL